MREVIQTTAQIFKFAKEKGISSAEFKKIIIRSYSIAWDLQACDNVLPIQPLKTMLDNELKARNSKAAKMVKREQRQITENRKQTEKNILASGDDQVMNQYLKKMSQNYFGLNDTTSAGSKMQP